MAITHGLLGVLVGALCATAELRPVLWQAFAGPAVVAGIGGAFGSLVYAHGGARGAVAALLDVVPSGLRRLPGSGRRGAGRYRQWPGRWRW